MKPKICRHCGRVSEGHYCRTVAPNETETCIVLARKRNVIQHNARIREQSASLNGGVPLGRSNKDLANRLAPLVLMSYSEVAKQLGMTASGVRLVELRALAKLRKLLLPFKNTQTGAEKVRVTCSPIPSL